jgi:hypothetical protein
LIGNLTTWEHFQSSVHHISVRNLSWVRTCKKFRLYCINFFLKTVTLRVKLSYTNIYSVYILQKFIVVWDKMRVEIQNT